jgi:hypothetical protein
MLRTVILIPSPADRAGVIPPATLYTFVPILVGQRAWQYIGEAIEDVMLFSTLNEGSFTGEKCPGALSASIPIRDIGIA